MAIIKGFRTIAASAALAVTGILGVLGTVDLQPIVALFVKNPAMLPVCMALLGIFFGVMRYFTTTPMFATGWAAPPEQAAPLKTTQSDAGE